jgi:hypothetical protein
MRLAKGVRLQLKLVQRGATTELVSTTAPMSPEQARQLWQEVADFAQRQALEDAAAPEPWPVVLPPELASAALVDV